METDYLVTKSYLESQALELASGLRRLEEEMDDMYKINLYLLRKYKDDLIQDLQIEIPEGIFNDPWFKLFETAFNQHVDSENETLLMILITNKIKDIMKEELPLPWYCYGFGAKVENGQ